MPCYSPLQGWRSRTRNESGKRGITFQMREGYIDQPVEVPCGQCIGCKIQKARQWALRCTHEATLHDRNCFITLTYNDDNCPNTLDKRELQLFLKRLRKEIAPQRIRHFAVGEYGEQFARPHYHLIIFGYDFTDKTYWSGTGERTQYRSKTLEKLWKHGFSTAGTVTTASAQYVAQYCTKKLTGPIAKDYYGDREPEFAIMSRGGREGPGGIGRGWIDKYKDSIFPRDFIVVEGGAKVAVPKYYTDAQNEALRRKLKNARLKRLENNPDNRGSRAVQKAACAEAKLKRRERPYEGRNLQHLRRKSGSVRPDVRDGNPRDGHPRVQ